jgi:prepilin-type N-terminal cleavage/methylation domain-containing protein
MKSEKGFTLLDLLTVVAVLGVVAAVSIPNLHRFLQRNEIPENTENSTANITISWASDNTDYGYTVVPSVTLHWAYLSEYDDSTLRDNIDAVYNGGGRGETQEQMAIRYQTVIILQNELILRELIKTNQDINKLRSPY